jgi:exopolysaccharide production protein ExoZ
MRQKYLTIQYLRGFAAIFVLASHALLYPIVGEHMGYSRLGWLGVILFFVISGFIMVAVTGEGRFSAVDFLRRRFVRVVPMYWGATLLAAALAYFAPTIFKTTVYDTGQLILSMLFIPFYNPASHGIHPLYKLGWTLNYEMFFYVCFALLAFLGAGKRVVWLTIALAALALAGAIFQPTSAVPQFYTSFMPLAFCAGAWLGLGALRGVIKAIPTPSIYVVGGLGLIGLVQGFVYQGEIVENGIAFCGLLAFATATVLLAIRLEPVIPHIRLLERIGDASYSIYLVHIYEVAILSGIAFKILDPQNVWADYLIAAVSIVGGTVAGLIVYELIEKPTLALMNRIFGKPRPKVTVPAE